MNIKASGTIESFSGGEGVVEISLDLKGQATDMPPTAKEVHVDLVLTVKSLVAEKLRYGERLYVTVSTKPPEES